LEPFSSPDPFPFRHTRLIGCHCARRQYRKPPRIIAKSPAWLTLFAVKRATHPPVFVAQT
ncbi:uncharacterized protein N7484_009941, partial [Penicillium longicatenatum]|uniref:uncharacterized protein n=1 Tax=Penicillium longicatenatum TaxID=1561947 RepID=UPI0025482DD6